jgi:acetolactate synthase-1/2/3 large subunit
MTTSAYTLLQAPVPSQTLIHVHAGAEELGRVYRPTLAINSGYPQFVDALCSLSFSNSSWKEEAEVAHKDYLAWSEPLPMPGKVQYGQIIRWLSDHLPADAILANGAGNFASWLHRHFRHKGFRTQLAPTNGSMGYGYPAAVGAKIAAPERTVVALCGDGDFLMNGQEIATAVQYNAAFVGIVVNNGMYGTIRMHQEREYPGRISGTERRTPSKHLRTQGRRRHDIESGQVKSGYTPLMLSVSNSWVLQRWNRGQCRSVARPVPPPQ